MSENSSELDMFETGRRSAGGDEIERIRAETARHNAEAEKIKAETARLTAEAEKIKAENERLAVQNAAARSKSLEEEELTKWEYTREDVKNGLEKLNSLGEQGWELTGITSCGGASKSMVFKRKKRSPQNQNNGFNYSR